jgi:putative chitinase
MITKEEILKVCKCNEKNLDIHFDSLIETFKKFNINTKERIAAFLANAIHETGGFKSFEENLNYSEKGLLGTFSKRVTPEQAKTLARNPEAIANHVYDKRNGNTDIGDGWKYRGRGIFQVTFKDNYSKVSKALKEDFVKNPDILTKAPYAALSAGVFWDLNKLNLLADKKDFLGIVKKINGGTNGLDDRQKYYDLFLK